MPDKATTDEVDIKTVDRERFLELAVQWENETVLLSSSDQATKHSAYREIVDMGQLDIPLILERVQSHNGHWIQALHDTTGADPVDVSDYGNIDAMEAVWYEWGKANGFA